MKLLSGRYCKKLADELAKKLDFKCASSITETFEDQELRVQINEPLYREDVVIIQSTSKPANDNLMELLLLVDAAKRAGAARITAIIPYFGYSRQDRPSYEFGPISASLVANLIETVGVNNIITIDLHSKQIEGFFKIGIQNLSSIKIFDSVIKNSSGAVVVSPDIGGIFRAREFSKKFNLDLAVINKSRGVNGQCSMNEIIGNVENKNCILIDDIVDTAGTICGAAKLLREKGAKKITAYITHAVLSGKAITLIENSQIDEFFISDTIQHEKLPDKFQIVQITDVLVNALKKISQHRSKH